MHLYIYIYNIHIIIYIYYTIYYNVLNIRVRMYSGVLSFKNSSSMFFHDLKNHVEHLKSTQKRCKMRHCHHCYPEKSLGPSSEV